MRQALLLTSSVRRSSQTMLPHTHTPRAGHDGSAPEAPPPLFQTYYLDAANRDMWTDREVGA